MTHDIEDGIEVSQEVAISASVSFWISKAEWEGMADEARKARIETAVDVAALRCFDDTIECGLGTFIAASIEGAKPDAPQVYDPNADL